MFAPFYLHRLFSNHLKNKNPPSTDGGFLVGVSGLEPEASWSRTKRDTKLRHTPLRRIDYYMEIAPRCQASNRFFIKVSITVRFVRPVIIADYCYMAHILRRL